MAHRSDAGAMQLTLAGKLLLFLVGLAILGFAGWTYRDKLPFKIPGTGGGTASSTTPSSSTPSSSDTTPKSQGNVLDRIRQNGVLRVGMEPDAPPLHFLNDKKQEDGFDFRLAGIVAEGVGAKKVEVVEADYDDLPDKLRSGAIDIIMAG